MVTCEVEEMATGDLHIFNMPYHPCPILPTTLPEPDSKMLNLESLFQIEHLDPHPFNLAQQLARRVASTKNKDAAVLFVGDKGLGKSVSACGLAHGVNRELYRLQPGRDMIDIFNWPRDISVIDPVTTLNCLNAARPKCCVVFLDDMSISMDSRRSMSRESIESSEVWITMRTMRQVVIGTTVTGSLIDKRARENFTYVIKMIDDTRYDDLFENGKGVRFGDLRGVYKDPLADELKFPRIKLKENGNNIVISKLMCFPPPRDLLDYYNGFRDSEAQRLRQKNLTPEGQEEEGFEPPRRHTAYDCFKEYVKEHKQNNNDLSAYYDEIWNAVKNKGFNVSRQTIVTYMNRK